jgi:hypothetical protein
LAIIHYARFVPRQTPDENVLVVVEELLTAFRLGNFCEDVRLLIARWPPLGASWSHLFAHSRTPIRLSLSLFPADPMYRRRAQAQHRDHHPFPRTAWGTENLVPEDKE